MATKKRTKAVTKETVLSGPDVLSKARYEELLKEWQENPLKLSNECLCRTVGTLTDKVLSGEVVVGF